MKVLLCRLRPATCAVALACLLCAAGCEPQEKEIVIISLNDLHSHIDDLDKVAAYVAEQRRQHPNVLLLSAGDIFSGSPVVDAYPEKGYPIIDLMNNAHFDASTLGNHEFDYGQATLAKRIEQAEFPFVCANINAAGSPIPPLAPYAMFNLSGEKVCVVGLIQEHPETHRDRIKNLRFASPQAELERHAFLREKCSVLLALTHVGLRE
ncbi:MAG: metallophosphoesterase, partial [Prevotellaceae bacterium]|nr:metallophosphoesterase [Prevotellaceae bacterium]